MTCPFRQNEECGIAADYLALVAPSAKTICREDAARTCGSCQCPHTLNYVSASLIFGQHRNKLPQPIQRELHSVISYGKQCKFGGVGEKLSKILSAKGWKTCGFCALLARKMDHNGVQWCILNKEDLLTSIIKHWRQLPISVWKRSRVRALRAAAIRLSKRLVPDFVARRRIRPHLDAAIFAELNEQKVTGQPSVLPIVRYTGRNVTGQTTFQDLATHPNANVTGQDAANGVYVLGYPSDVGGADTELGHTLRVWRAHGLQVSLIPTNGPPAYKHRLECDAAGCRTVLGGVAKIPDGATVVGFCNAAFLDAAPALHARGCKLVWVNCMCWLFDKETEYYRTAGRTFDAYVFQSNFQRDKLEQGLLQTGCYTLQQGNLIRGAFDCTAWQFHVKPRANIFTVGRLARPDLDKWSSNTWPIYSRIRYADKYALLMGVDDRVLSKIGPTPTWGRVLPPNHIPALQFFKLIDCLLPVNGGAMENWPRAGLEAMASGVPIVTQNQWGWKELIKHGETGFLADTDMELAEYADLLAANPNLYSRVASNAREALEEMVKPIGQQWVDLFKRLQQ